MNIIESRNNSLIDMARRREAHMAEKTNLSSKTASTSVPA
jgi:hypothetical protein